VFRIIIHLVFCPNAHILSILPTIVCRMLGPRRKMLNAIQLYRLAFENMEETKRNELPTTPGGNDQRTPTVAGDRTAVRNEQLFKDLSARDVSCTRLNEQN
jgi:hypothetical protein